MRVLTVLALALPGVASADCVSDYLDADPNADFHLPTPDCIGPIVHHFERIRPDRVQVRAIGRSTEGRRIWAVRITQNPESSGSWYRPSALVVAATHGGEAGSQRQLLDWLRFAASATSADEAYPGGPDMDALLSSRQIWLVPLVNADDGDFVFRGGSRCNPNGVNLNRDFGFRWSEFTGPGTPASGCPGDRDMTGSIPFSQRETRALAGLFKVAQPSVFMSMHGSGTQAGPNPDPNGLPYVMARPGAITNWGVPVPRTVYTWTGSGFTNNGAKRGLDAEVLLEPTDPLSLNRLAEDASGGTRVHSPYDPAVVDGAPGVSSGGAAAQARSWAWVEEGAISVLYESLAQDPSGVLSDPLFSSRTDEIDMLDITTDFRAPMGRFVDLADNPLEDATGSLDLAVDRVVAMEGACDRLETFWPESGTATPSDDFRNGQFGSYDVKCHVRNWGSTALPSDAITVTVDILDHTDPALGQTQSDLLGALSPGQVRRVSPTTTHDFVEGHSYTVRCSIGSNAYETDNQTVTVIDDPGCAATNGVGPHCEATSSGYDAVFPTNNEREIRFVANRSADLVCRDSRRLPVNLTGAPVASVPAVVTR